jgi:putative flavoprotein involved in K+ transport
MKQTDVIVIGGGQAGLAMSRSLAARGIDHVVLERGRVGERWRSERWDSLHLLTPNSHSALPGRPHLGADPDGFLSAAQFAEYLDDYAAAIGASVAAGVEVIAVSPLGDYFRLETTAGCWQSRAVIVATGACAVPFRPLPAERLSDSIRQMLPRDYRAPDQLATGGVLVVGASSTGLQLAEEIHASGRPVILAVGNHTRMPRRYRGRDIYAWMDDIGMLDERAEDAWNLEAARRQPSPQLVGRRDHRNLDLGILRDQGVRLLGRLAFIERSRVGFSGDLAETTARSHERMRRVLDRIDACIARHGLEEAHPRPEPVPGFFASEAPAELDLIREGVRSVVWATGYVRRYPWLKLPVLDHRGEIVHRGGITAVPGLYVLGLTFLRRRRSHFIDGVGLDAEELAELVLAHLASASRAKIAGLRESRR